VTLLERRPFFGTGTYLAIILRHAFRHIFVYRLTWSALRACCIIQRQILLRLFVTVQAYRFSFFLVGGHGLMVGSDVRIDTTKNK